jgi:hypothetical protein
VRRGLREHEPRRPRADEEEPPPMRKKNKCNAEGCTTTAVYSPDWVWWRLCRLGRERYQDVFEPGLIRYQKPNTARRLTVAQEVDIVVWRKKQ